MYLNLKFYVKNIDINYIREAIKNVRDVISEILKIKKSLQSRQTIMKSKQF